MSEAAAEAFLIDLQVGRPELRQYIVSVREVGRGESYPPWEPPVPHAVYLRYDAGYSEVCPGRDAGLVILYEIPRKQRAIRQPWFMKGRNAANSEISGLS